LPASTATFITGGERISLLEDTRVVQKPRLNLPLKVLFEDDQIAAIYKPAGVQVSGNKFKTIANALSQNLKTSTQKDACVPQPVHRLDYPTTGVLLVGKTHSVIRAMNQQFENKMVHKTYLAVTIFQMNKNQGEFNTLVDGKEALTSYEVKDSVRSDRFGQLNLVKLHPKTGRRHQLRKHLAESGNAILGDADYSPEDLLLKGKGLYLHAYSVVLKHPFTKNELTIRAEVPEKFKKLFPTMEF